MLIKSLPENPLPSTFMCVAVFTRGASSPHHIMIASFYHCAKSIQVVFSKKKDPVATGLLTFVFQFFYENEIFRLFTVKKLARTHTRHIFSQSVPLPHCVCVYQMKAACETRTIEKDESIWNSYHDKMQ